MHHTFCRLSDVRLCDWTDRDRRGYADLVADPDVMTYISAGRPRSRAHADREVDAFKRELDDRGWSRWAVCLGDDERFTGYAGFAEKPYGVDFGKRFLKTYWGTGLNYIASHLAMTYGFDAIGFDRVHTLVHVENIKVLRFVARYFGLVAADGDSLDLPHGRHLNFPASRALFLRRRAENDDHVQKLAARLVALKAELS